MNNIPHTPVLVDEILDLIPKNATIIVDATCGTGGHSVAMATNLKSHAYRQAGQISNFKIIGIDYDKKSIKKANEILAKFHNIELACANFKNIQKIVGDKKIDFILADLGFSSWQLDDNRGLAFSQNQPLDMRLDTRRKTTAADLVNHLDENELADLIYQNSDEQFSRPISRAICHARPIFTTEKLAKIINQAIGWHYRKKINPATLSFQALRMAVNQEKENLEQFLRYAPECLATGGILAIISFHSQEAKAVKTHFKRLAKTKRFEILTKQPITPGLNEIRSNPRSRSARLIACKKIA